MNRPPTFRVGFHNEIPPTGHALSMKNPFALYLNLAKYPLMTVRELSPNIVHRLALASEGKFYAARLFSVSKTPGEEWDPHQLSLLGHLTEPRLAFFGRHRTCQ